MNTNTAQTNNMDFTDALSNMITPNNSTQIKQKKPPKKKTTKSKTPTKPKPTKPKTTKKTTTTKITNNKNPNQLTKQEISQVNQVNNTTPPKQKTKAQSNKDFKKAQLQSNNKQRINLFNGVLDNINNERQENNQPILSLQRFTTITNTLMKIFNDMKYLIQDTDTINNLLVNKMTDILDTIKDKSINTKRKIITDIITILNSNNDTKIKDIKKYEYYRKSLYLKNNDNDKSNPNPN
jgi:hypothetical protein